LEQAEEQSLFENDDGESQNNEHINQGKVSLKQYMNYWRSGTSVYGLFFLIFLFIATQSLVSGSDYWVTICIARDTHPKNSSFSSISQIEYFISDTTNNCLGTYTILVSGLFLIALTRSIYYFDIARRASKKVHESMLHSTMHARMNFYRHTPAGRIINRCVARRVQRMVFLTDPFMFAGSRVICWL